MDVHVAENMYMTSRAKEGVHVFVWTLCTCVISSGTTTLLGFSKKIATIVLFL